MHTYLQRYTFNIRLQDSCNRCCQCICNIQRYVASIRMFANVWQMLTQCIHHNVNTITYANIMIISITFMHLEFAYLPHFNQLVLQDYVMCMFAVIRVTFWDNNLNGNIMEPFNSMQLTVNANHYFPTVIAFVTSRFINQTIQHIVYRTSIDNNMLLEYGAAPLLTLEIDQNVPVNMVKRIRRKLKCRGEWQAETLLRSGEMCKPVCIGSAKLSDRSMHAITKWLSLYRMQILSGYLTNWTEWPRVHVP